LRVSAVAYSIKASMIVTWRDRIGAEPNVLGGKPVIKGTRLSVEFIVGLVEHGWGDDDIIGNYPGITREDILACLSYASSS